MHQVGEFTDDPPMNSMAILKSTAVLEEGTTYVFGSWICFADDLNDFNSHLTNSREFVSASINDVGNLSDC